MRSRRCPLLKKALVLTLIVATTLSLTLPPKGWAMLIPAQTAVADEAGSSRAADVKTIQKSLESELIRQRLKEFKLSPEQIDARLRQMSDDQVHQVAMQIRSVNPGGDPGGFIVSVLVIGILVLVFVWLAKRV